MPIKKAEYVGIIEIPNDPEGYRHIMKRCNQFFTAHVFNTGYRRTSLYYDTLEELYDHIESGIESQKED